MQREWPYIAKYKQNAEGRACFFAWGRGGREAGKAGGGTPMSRYRPTHISECWLRPTPCLENDIATVMVKFIMETTWRSIANASFSLWTPVVFFPSFIFYVNFDSLRNRITHTVGIHIFSTIFIFINAVYYQLLKGIGSKFNW